MIVSDDAISSYIYKFVNELAPPKRRLLRQTHLHLRAVQVSPSPQ